MSIFFWKKNRLIDQFSHTLASDFFSSVPTDMLVNTIEGCDDHKSKKEKLKKNDVIRKAVTQAAGEIVSFKETHSLGVYGKARLHLIFLERLEELGYSRENAELINKILLVETP